MHPNELLKNLIRFNTSNPPGNELECIMYIKGILEGAGIETKIIAKDPNRPNLIARVRGASSSAPLLLQGHVDVVTTEGQVWTHPPFDAVEQDGFIWGRGALDMKSGVTMMISALLRLKEQNLIPKSDIILCLMSDEETGSAAGAKYLVEDHPEQFEGVNHALGEFGGFSTYLGGKKFYLIQTEEKRSCELLLTLRGPAGHGSQPFKGTAVARLGRVLTQLDKKQAPVTMTETTQRMLSGMASALTQPSKTIIQLLAQPALSNTMLKAFPKQLGILSAMLRSTVSPTMIRASKKINVIPAEVSLKLDGRILPQVEPDEFVNEIKGIIGQDLDLTVTHYDPKPKQATDLSQFEFLADILREKDDSATVIPYLQPAVTDGRYFARLGIQTYGFTPMDLPQDFNFAATIHAADERIPTDALEFGVEAMLKAIERYEV